MNLSFSLSNDPRRLLSPRDRNAYASQYIANLAMWFKLASTLTSESDPCALPKRVVDQLTVELGLPVSSSAKVLRVTRPTVYSWLKKKQAPQSAQLERLRYVSKAAQLVARVLREKQDLDLSAVLPDGASVLSLLSAEQIDFARLESALQTLRDLPVRYFAEIPDEALEEEGKVNQALLNYLRKAPM